MAFEGKVDREKTIAQKTTFFRVMQVGSHFLVNAQTINFLFTPETSTNWDGFALNLNFFPGVGINLINRYNK